MINTTLYKGLFMFTYNIPNEHTGIMKAIPKLQERAEFLSSNEDFDVFVKNIASFFTNKLSAISATFLTNATRSEKTLTNDYNVFIKDIVALSKDIENIKSKVSFIDVEKMSIPIMLGMRTDLYKTAMVLKEATTLIAKELPKAIDECDSYVAKVISDKNVRTATRGVLGYNTTSRTLRHELEKMLETIIDPNSVIDKKTIREMLPNLNSLNKIQSLLIDSAEDATLDNLKHITEASKRIAEKTDSFYNIITTTDMVISKVIIGELSYVLEETANNITLAVTFWQILNQTAAVFKMMVEMLDGVSKK